MDSLEQVGTVLKVLGILGLVLFLRRYLNLAPTLNSANGEHTVRAIAKRFGFRIIEGHPNFLLAFDSIGPSGAGVGAGLASIRVKLAGWFGGREVEVRYQSELSQVSDNNEVCSGSIAVDIAHSVPDFEAVRSFFLGPGFGSVRATVRTEIPSASLGDPELDERVEFHCADPRVGLAISRSLKMLDSRSAFHVAKAGDRLMFVIDHNTRLPMLGMLATHLYVLCCMAAALEGKPVPEVPAIQDPPFRYPFASVPGADPAAVKAAEAAPPVAIPVPTPPAPSLLSAIETQGSGAAADGSEQLPIPCTRCGAPMKECFEQSVDGKVTVECQYCGNTEQLPANAGERVAAIRARLQQVRWAMDRVSGANVTLVQVVEVIGVPVFMLVWATLVGIAGYHLAVAERVDAYTRRDSIFEVLLVPTAMLTVMVVSMMVVVAAKRYRSRSLPILAARPPLAAGQNLRCRVCGGDLESKASSFIRCRYCGCQNLVTKEAAVRVASGLDAEVHDWHRLAARAELAADKSILGAGRLSASVGVVGVSVFVLLWGAVTTLPRFIR